MPELHPHWDTGQNFDEARLALKQYSNFEISVFENPEGVKVYDDIYQDLIEDDVFLCLQVNSLVDGWLYITLSVSRFEDGDYELEGVMTSSGVEELQYTEGEEKVECDRCQRELELGEYRLEFYRGWKVTIHAHRCWKVILESIESVLQQV